MEEVQDTGKRAEERLGIITNSLDLHHQRLERREKVARAEGQNRQLRFVMSKLDPANYEADHEFASDQRRVSKTSGEWLLNHPEFDKWADTTTPGNMLLFMNGIPGAGKEHMSRVHTLARHRE